MVDKEVGAAEMGEREPKSRDRLVAISDLDVQLEINNRSTYSFVLMHGDLLFACTLNVSSTGSTSALRTRCKKMEQKLFLRMDQ